MLLLAAMLEQCPRKGGDLGLREPPNQADENKDRKKNESDFCCSTFHNRSRVD